MFSSRSGLDRAENTFNLAVNPQLARGSAFCDLTLSNPTQAQFEYPISDLCRALATPEGLSYRPDPFGLLQARQTLAQVLKTPGFAPDPADILLTASTSEAYSFIFKLLCDPGDNVLVPVPSYPLFECLARFEGVELRPYPLDYDGAWHISLDVVRHAHNSRTKAIIVVSPNNPTGSYLKRGELEQLAQLGLPIISDEVFAHYPLQTRPEQACSASDCADTLVFCLGGLSKWVGLPQLKLAWTTLGGPQFMRVEARARLELIADSFLSVCSPVQHALPALLHPAQRVTEQIQNRIQYNWGKLPQLLSGSAATVLHAEGGWYATLRLPNTLPEEAWVAQLLAEELTLVQPGYFYDFLNEPYIILSLLTPESEFERGVQSIVRCTARHA